MNCLCCGKRINEKDNMTSWHKICIKRFFGTDTLPEIDLSEESLRKLAEQTISQGLTIPGVQKKLSFHLFSGDENPRLTLMDYPSGYILKPQSEEYPCLPEAEHLVMNMADAAGIATVPHALLVTDFGYAYITKRIDRVSENGNTEKIAMEDFCQLDGRLTADKYKGSYERCAKIIDTYSYRSGLDLSELFYRIIFCFVTGNSDMHLKNFSLIQEKPGSTNYVLSPAYDLLPVNLILPEDNEETALTLTGKKSNIHLDNFVRFAESCRLNEKTARKLISRIVSFEGRFLRMCDDSYLPDELKEQFKALISKRISILILDKKK